MKRLFPLLMLFLSLLPVIPVSGQNKVAAETKRDKEKRAKTDPWAEFEEEVDSIPRWDFGLNLGAYFPNK